MGESAKCEGDRSTVVSTGLRLTGLNKDHAQHDKMGRYELVDGDARISVCSQLRVNNRCVWEQKEVHRLDRKPIIHYLFYDKYSNKWTVAGMHDVKAGKLRTCGLVGVNKYGDFLDAEFQWCDSEKLIPLSEVKAIKVDSSDWDTVCKGTLSFMSNKVGVLRNTSEQVGKTFRLTYSQIEIYTSGGKKKKTIDLNCVWQVYFVEEKRALILTVADPTPLNTPQTIQLNLNGDYDIQDALERLCVHTKLVLDATSSRFIHMQITLSGLRHINNPHGQNKFFDQFEGTYTFNQLAQMWIKPESSRRVQRLRYIPDPIWSWYLYNDNDESNWHIAFDEDFTKYRLSPQPNEECYVYEKFYLTVMDAHRKTGQYRQNLTDNANHIVVRMWESSEIVTEKLKIMRGVLSHLGIRNYYVDATMERQHWNYRNTINTLLNKNDYSASSAEEFIEYLDANLKGDSVEIFIENNCKIQLWYYACDTPITKQLSVNQREWLKKCFEAGYSYRFARMKEEELNDGI